MITVAFIKGDGSPVHYKIVASEARAFAIVEQYNDEHPEGAAYVLNGD